jgi:hypothetical protein
VAYQGFGRDRRYAGLLSGRALIEANCEEAGGRGAQEPTSGAAGSRLPTT